MTGTSSTVVIALGSNLGDRRYHLLRAVHELRHLVRIVCLSPIEETAPVDAPDGSPPFLNMVVVGHTNLPPASLLAQLLTLETRLGRIRPAVRNAPRVIDLDLILHGATRLRTPCLTLPHPRAATRPFVLTPLRACHQAAAAFVLRG